LIPEWRGYFQTEIKLLENKQIEVTFTIENNKEGNFEDLEIELNLNQDKTTTILGYEGPFSVEDKKVIVEYYDLKGMEDNGYEVESILYQRGKEKERITGKLNLYELGSFFGITGNVIAFDNLDDTFKGFLTLFIFLFVMLVVLGLNFLIRKKR